MMNFANLEQRMTHAYLDMFPPFVPLEDGEAPVQSQNQFYRFMKSVLQTLFDTPELFFKKTNPDDAFPNRFNRAAYGKPKLYTCMKKDLTEIDGLLSMLFSLGQNSTLEDGKLILSETMEIKKKYHPVLPLLGLKLDQRVLSCDKFDNLFPAWRWMATRENASVLTFSRGMFDPEYAYMQAIYAPLFGNENAYYKLVQYLIKKGYQHVELRRGPYTLDYVKQNVEKDVPLGDPKHGDPDHYGIAMEYKPDAAIPQFLVLRILEMKNLLLKFDLMRDDLKDFVIHHVKKCDSCGYCTQTDKSGKRQPLHITVIHNGEYSICPLYPGFNFCFTELDDALVTHLKAFLDFMEKHLTRSPHDQG